jgi:hypothetical protein
VIGTLIVVFPIITSEMPLLADYPNHLVRFWLLNGGASIPTISNYFTVDWSNTATNIVMDAVVYALCFVFPVTISGKIILALSALLPAIGILLVSTALYQRVSHWHVLIFLVCWALTLLTGFMSFRLGLGAALIALWLDIILERQGQVASIVRRTAQWVVIVLVHPFGILLYLVISTGFGIGSHASVLLSRQGLGTVVRRLAWNYVPFALAAVLILMRIELSDHGAGTGASSLPIMLWDQIEPRRVLRSLIAPERAYNIAYDAVFALLLWGLVTMSAFQRRLLRHEGLIVAGIGLFIFSHICPNVIGTTSMIDARLWEMVLLTMCISVLPELNIEARYSGALYAVAFIALLARSAYLDVVWQQRQADVQSVYRALDHVPEASRLIPLQVKTDPRTAPPGRYLAAVAPTFEHLIVSAVMRRHAYVPTLFAESGKQPVTVRPAYAALHEMSGGAVATAADLKSGHAAGAKYLSRWKTDFDYILVLNADQNSQAEVIDDETCLVADEGFAKLYRITNQKHLCK